MSTGSRVLDGIKVLDVGTWVASPAAPTIMSDFGAEVIKIEPPRTGDPYRQLPAVPGMPLSEHNYSWLLDSRNKKSLALDVTRPEGRDVLQALVARADVFVTNFPPALLARLGLTYEDLSPVTRGWSTPRSRPTARWATRPTSPASTSTPGGRARA